MKCCTDRYTISTEMLKKHQSRANSNKYIYNNNQHIKLPHIIKSPLYNAIGNMLCRKFFYWH